MDLVEAIYNYKRFMIAMATLIYNFVHSFLFFKKIQPKTFCFPVDFLTITLLIEEN